MNGSIPVTDDAGDAAPSRLGFAQSSQTHMKSDTEIAFLHKLESHDQFVLWWADHQLIMQAQRAYEAELSRTGKDLSFSGWCCVCSAPSVFMASLPGSGDTSVNWREQLVCRCGLSNRLRAAVHMVRSILQPPRDARLYFTEQVTPLANWAAGQFPNAEFSEFLRDGTASGARNSSGIRHEDLTSLSFENGTVDGILSFEVLEHIPDYRAALRELARILRPGGWFLGSFPFDGAAMKTLIRAVIRSDGSVVHLLPPEYHGDPIDGSGCLCFQVFGWDVLQMFRDAGFSSAYVMLYWSAEFGYLGPVQTMVLAHR